jgi:DNA invertase Pin-like site-specific DNA recombinase
MIVGYVRTSTLDQVARFEAQLDELSNIGVEKFFKEQVSTGAQLEQLDAALEYVRDVDVLVATKLDRLARSVQHLWRIVEQLDAKGVILRILNLGIDTGNATGRLILTVLGGIAQFEREMVKERHREGIERAKRAGKYKGRKATARALKGDIQRLTDDGIKASEIGKRLGNCRASVYRYVEKSSI